MKLLIVRDSFISSARKREIETSLRFLNEYTDVEWEIEYHRDRDLVENMILEGEDDLDEHHIQEYIGRDDVDFIHLDFTDSDWDKLELRSTLYGQAEWINGQGISYGRWTERNADRVEKLPKHLQFLSEVGLGIIHELSHSIGASRKLNHTTHYYFYGYDKKYNQTEESKLKPDRWERTPDPDVFFKSISFKETPMPTRGTILPVEYEDKISQPYLSPASFYAAGYHIGIDWACPLWTPVYAPFDGRVTRNEVNHSVLGNAGYFLYTNPEGNWEAFRFMHLAVPPLVGDYKKGDIIGYTGNTGFSTGPHLHIDVWQDGVIRIAKIKDKPTIVAYTKDPLLAFGLEKEVVTPAPEPVKTLSDYTEKELLNELIKRV